MMTILHIELSINDKMTVFFVILCQVCSENHVGTRIDLWHTSLKTKKTLKILI